MSDLHHSQRRANSRMAPRFEDPCCSREGANDTKAGAMRRDLTG